MGLLWGRGGESKSLERIKALEEAVDRLESRLRLIKTEWESVLDKVNSVMGRLNARIRKSEAVSPSENDVDATPQAPATPEIGGTHAQLSAMRTRRGVLSR